MENVRAARSAGGGPCVRERRDAFAGRGPVARPVGVPRDRLDVLREPLPRDLNGGEETAGQIVGERQAKEGIRLRDEGGGGTETGEIFVTRDSATSAVELHVGSTAANDTRIIHLTNEEARRLAALLLFQATRLERPRAIPDLPRAEPERESA